MESGHPRAARLTPQRQRELAPIAPSLGARRHGHLAHVAAPDPVQRVPYDRPLGAELRVIRQMLELASPAAISVVVHAQRRHPLDGGPQHRHHPTPRKASPTP